VQERLQRLIEAFDHFDKTYKRSEMEEAITLREEITPHLLGILDEVVANPDRYIEEEHYGNIYASALLAHFREVRAHRPLIRAFSLSRDQLDGIWGDISTETLPAMLVLTCGESVEGIQELVRDRNADEYVRVSAMTAVTYAVVRGVISREDALAFFATLFARSLAEEDSYFWQGLANSIEDLEGAELAGAVRTLVADGLVPEWEIAPWFMEEPQFDLFAGEKVIRLEKLKHECDLRIPEDIHGYCSWFGCFQEYKPYSRQFGGEDRFFSDPAPRNTDRKNKDKTRKKRKLAKQSKRKNRK
jgi:hypothetical protein